MRCFLSFPYRHEVDLCHFTTLLMSESPTREPVSQSSSSSDTAIAATATRPPPRFSFGAAALPKPSAVHASETQPFENAGEPSAGSDAAVLPLAQGARFTARPAEGRADASGTEVNVSPIPQSSSRFQFSSSTHAAEVTSARGAVSHQPSFAAGRGAAGRPKKGPGTPKVLLREGWTCVLTFRGGVLQGRGRVQLTEERHGSDVHQKFTRPPMQRRRFNASYCPGKFTQSTKACSRARESNALSAAHRPREPSTLRARSIF